MESVPGRVEQRPPAFLGEWPWELHPALAFSYEHHNHQWAGKDSTPSKSTWDIILPACTWECVPEFAVFSQGKTGWLQCDPSPQMFSLKINFI